MTILPKDYNLIDLFLATQALYHEITTKNSPDRRENWVELYLEWQPQNR